MEYFSKGRSPKKSRKGATPVNVETLMEQNLHDKSKLSCLQFRCFSEALREKLAAASGVSTQEALAAAKELAKPRTPTTHLEMAGLGATATPIIGAASRASRGFLDTPGNLRARLRGAAKEVGKATVGDVGSQVVGGGLTGGLLSASREGLQVAKAKKKVKGFLSAPVRRREKRKVERLLAKAKSDG